MNLEKRKITDFLNVLGAGIVAGIKEGLQEGATEGIKGGTKEGLIGCLKKGFVNLETISHEELLDFIIKRGSNITEDVKKELGNIVKNHFEEYLDKLSRDFKDESQGEKLIKTAEKEVSKRKDTLIHLEKAKLRHNPISSLILKGIQPGLEEGLDKSTEVYRKKLRDRLRSGIESQPSDKESFDEKRELGAIEKNVKDDVRAFIATIATDVVNDFTKKIIEMALSLLKAKKYFTKLEETLRENTQQWADSLADETSLLGDKFTDYTNKQFIESLDKEFTKSLDDSFRSSPQFREVIDEPRRQLLKNLGTIGGAAAVGAGLGGGTVWAVSPEKEVSKYVCPYDRQEFDTLDELADHMGSAHPAETETVTTTQQVGEVTTTTTVTQTVYKYVCPYDGMEFDTLAALEAHIEAEHPSEELTKLTVNGETHKLDLKPTWSLAFVLREKLGLTGTKVGCDRGSCGTCTVIADGRAVYACTILAVEAEGMDILTMEGLSDGITLHAIQQAFIDNDAVQCGYCIPGYMMAAKALLDANSSPTRDEVREALSGHLCICGNTKKIVAAVLSV